MNPLLFTCDPVAEDMLFFWEPVIWADALEQLGCIREAQGALQKLRQWMSDLNTVAGM